MDGNEYRTVMIFKRKKDDPSLRKSTVCVYQDCLKTKQIVENKDLYDMIARFYNARVYVSVNARDMRKARKDLIVRMVYTEDSQNHESSLKNQLFSSLMKSPKRGGKRFMLDVDDEDQVVSLEHFLEDRGVRYNIVQTPNGYHIICDPFDTRIIDAFENVEVKKDGMTYMEYLTEGLQ